MAAYRLQYIVQAILDIMAKVPLELLKIVETLVTYHTYCDLLTFYQYLSNLSIM